MRALRVLFATGAATTMVLVTGAVASAEEHGRNLVCSGGPIAAGSYESITVTGLCFIPGDSSTVISVRGDVSIRPNAALAANFPGPGPLGAEGDAALKVRGDVRVGAGGTLLLGCAPSFGCNITSADVIQGDLIATKPLGLLIHGNTIKGDVKVNGGGGGVQCVPAGAFAQFGSPVYTTFEDNTFGGDVSVTNLHTCWDGFFRNAVSGDVNWSKNITWDGFPETTFADTILHGDEDGNEIANNTIHGDLKCFNNMPVMQFGDSGGTPSTVYGDVRGECVGPLVIQIQKED